MKNILIIVACLVSVLESFGQNPMVFYRRGDSLYRAKDYRNSALSYSEGIRIQGANADTRRYTSAAGSWAMAEIPDSAFQLLNSVAVSEKVSKVDLQQLEWGTAYASLRTDNRWKKMMETLKKQAEKNGYPQEEFIYGRKDGMALTLVWIKPKIKSNGKSIVAIRSGNWVSSFNGIEITPLGLEQYMEKGYTVFAVMHGSQPRYAIPEQVSDLRRAVRYIRYNAGKFKIDADRIGITGGSSGGHLALLVATADDNINTTSSDPVDRMSSRIQAAAVLFPPTDLLNWGGAGFNMVNANALLKASQVWGAVDFKTWNEKFAIYEEVSDTVARSKIGREVSPIYAVSSDDPPVFIIHGDADPVVPLQQSKAIIARLTEANVPNNLIIKKGGKHSATDMNPEWQQFVDWFDRHLK